MNLQRFFCCCLCLLSFVGVGFAAPDISEAVLKEQAVGLEATEKTLEEHLQEKSQQEMAQPEISSENPEEIFEAPIPEDIPFEDGASDESDSQLASASENFEGAVLPENSQEKLYEKTAALEPVLMVRGNPVEEMSENSKKEKLRGRIIPEKRNITRRRYMFRWVLQTEDGRRIPLKSNLKLLSLVRKEELLDGPAMLTGYFVASALNPELRYFNVENAVPAGDADEDKPEKAATKKVK